MMIRFNVGETQVLPLLLPGLILTIGVLLILTGMNWANLELALQGVGDKLESDAGGGAFAGLIAIISAVGVLGLYVASMLMGATLAIIGGYVEYHFLDSYRSKRFGITKDEFWGQWQRYLDHLENRKSSYISDYVDLFLFALRSCIALLFVSLFALFARVAPWWLIVIGLIASSLLALVAVRYHRELAEYRKRRFSEVPVSAQSDIADDKGASQ